MKKTSFGKKLLSMTVGAAMVLSLGACSGGSTGSSAAGSTAGTGSTSSTAKEQVLKIWVANAIVADTEQKLPQDQWTISKIASAFEQANPGVKVEITLVADQSASMQTFKAAANTDTCPDIVNVWSGQTLFDMSDILLDISGMIPEQDKKDVIGWETTTMGYEEGNAIYGYPTSGNEVCGFFYNKDVMAKAGLDFDTNPPKTLEEFSAACDKIAKAGFQPIMAANGGWNGSFFTSFANLWVQQSGTPRIYSNCLGETKFADDAGLTAAYDCASGLFKAGYINEDYDTIKNASEVFLQGEAAMYATGNWDLNAAIEALGEDKVGFFCFNGKPIGGSGQALSIYKNTPNAQLAVDFLSFLSNRENSISLLKAVSKLPLRSDITSADLGFSDAVIYQQLLEKAQDYVFYADNTMSADVSAEMQSLGSMVITGKMTAAEMAAQLDKVAAQSKK